MKYLLVSVILLATLGFATAKERVILKSGKVVMGDVTVKGDQVILKTRYGRITYDKKNVTVKKEKQYQSSVTDLSKTSPKGKIDDQLKRVPYLLTTKSGRKIKGDILEKDGKLFLYEFGGLVQLNDYTIAKKELITGKGLKGDVISGERCNVLLKSGRAFSGIVEEKADYLLVTSMLGSVRLDRKLLASYKRTGLVLDLRKRRAPAKKASSDYSTRTPSVAVGHKGAKKNPVITLKDDDLDPDKHRANIMNSLKKAKGKTKLLSNYYSIYD